jgi:phospholipid transport system substrate-binding protein
MSEKTSNRGACQGSISPTTRLGTIRAVMAVMVALLMLIGATSVSAEQTPTESVKRTIDNVIQILNTDALKQPSRSVERRQKIEDVVRQRVSYEDMARLALGKPWIALTDNERQEFVSLFAQLLRDMFAGKIDDIADVQVQYLSEQREKSFAEVRTKLLGQKIDTLLDFRLADKFGHWYVYDVAIDDASIVSNYRAQFASIIRDHSYAGLVKKMKEKTLVVKAFETTTAP